MFFVVFLLGDLCLIDYGVAGIEQCSISKIGLRSVLHLYNELFSFHGTAVYVEDSLPVFHSRSKMLVCDEGNIFNDFVSDDVVKECDKDVLTFFRAEDLLEHVIVGEVCVSMFWNLDVVFINHDSNI